MKTPERFADRRPSGRPAPKVRPHREGPLHVEILSVGRELLRGNVQDVNGRYLAQRLSRRGALVHRVTVVDDHVPAIAGALREALGRHPHLVITSGGLGSAADDRTLEAVAEVLGCPLSLNARARTMVEEAYQREYRARRVTNAALNETREKMCRLPVGGEPLPNSKGIVPGVFCRLPGGAALLCLPGLPREMRCVLDEALPRFEDQAPETHIAQREVEAPVPDESALHALIERLSEEFPYLWISSRTLVPGKDGALKVVVTLEARGASEPEADSAVDPAVRRLLALASGSC